MLCPSSGTPHALSPGAVAELETGSMTSNGTPDDVTAEQLCGREQSRDFERRQGLIAEELTVAVKDLGAAHPHATVAIVVGSSSLVTHRVVGSAAVSLARHSPVPLVVVTLELVACQAVGQGDGRVISRLCLAAGAWSG
jgi:hypothetical protein